MRAGGHWRDPRAQDRTLTYYVANTGGPKTHGGLGGKTTTQGGSWCGAHDAPANSLVPAHEVGHIAGVGPGRLQRSTLPRRGRNLLGNALAWRRTVRRAVAAGNAGQHRGWGAPLILVTARAVTSMSPCGQCTMRNPANPSNTATLVRYRARAGSATVHTRPHSPHAVASALPETGPQPGTSSNEEHIAQRERSVRGADAPEQDATNVIRHPVSCVRQGHDPNARTGHGRQHTQVARSNIDE